MKAALLLAPGQLVVKQIPEPTIGEYDALCELLYGAVCAGTDQHLLHGRFPWPIGKYPTVLGHESVGRVTKVGAKVRHFKVGDLITRVGTPPAADGSFNVTWGGYTQVGVARDHRAMKEDGRPAHEWSGYRINQVVPPGIDPAHATMLITWRETYSYIHRMGIAKGKSLLVVGSGGNGLAFAAHARNAGASSIALAGNPNRADAGKRLGIDHYLDYRDPNLLATLQKVQPAGFDLIIDAVGKIGLADAVSPAVASGGVIGIYGIDDYNKLTLNPFRPGKTFSFYNGGYDEAEAHDPVIALMQQGKLDASVWLNLDSPFPLDEINAALDAVERRVTIKSLVKLT
ncbi:MAG: zinc-binding dehydrogenase [Planctomycetota bacterium]|nr:zinc-binding dehydrogenase [Planctomycetota bacterium]